MKLPLGLYESLIQQTLAEKLADQIDGDFSAHTRTLENDEERQRVLVDLLKNELGHALSDAPKADRADTQLRLILDLLRVLRGEDAENLAPVVPLKLLTSISSVDNSTVESPRTGLSQSWLFTDT